MTKKKESEITFRSWLIKNLFAVAAVAVALANIWLAGRLYPLSQSIEVVAVSVSLNDMAIKNNTVRIIELKDDLKYIRNRVDLIYSELNK